MGACRLLQRLCYCLLLFVLRQSSECSFVLSSAAGFPLVYHCVLTFVSWEGQAPSRRRNISSNSQSAFGQYRYCTRYLNSCGGLRRHLATSHTSGKDRFSQRPSSPFVTVPGSPLPPSHIPYQTVNLLRNSLVFSASNK